MGVFGLYKPLAKETFNPYPNRNSSGLKSSYMAHLQSKQNGYEVVDEKLREIFDKKKELLDKEKLAKTLNGVVGEGAIKVNKGENIQEAGIFKKDIICDELRQRMEGLSWKENDVIRFSDLSYLTMSYWGFDDKPHLGEMVVHKDVADEVLEIFRELYENKYYIDKMKLIDEYEASDDASMADNNSSAFCYRIITGGKRLSTHSYGLSIDINPVMNPYVKGDITLPETGAKYVERRQDVKGLITKGDICYEAFTKRGWVWGGDWTSPIDYQHFEKKK